MLEITYAALFSSAYILAMLVSAVWALASMFDNKMATDWPVFALLALLWPVALVLLVCYMIGDFRARRARW
jgi:hypothetical protein